MGVPDGTESEALPKAQLRRVRWGEDIETVRRLFQEYRQWLADHRDPAPLAANRVTAGLELVDGLIATLPGAYGPPRGDVLLWIAADGIAACGALRGLEPSVGEIKRIFVRSDYRGKEFGRPFVRAMIDRARELGYKRLRADTLPSMTAAIEFYQELEFRPVPAYWPHPVAGAIFFERAI